MKKSILLVSHSQQLTDGLKAMIEDMSDSETVTLFSLGGTAEGELGSDPTKIVESGQSVSGCRTRFSFLLIWVVPVLNAELAYDMLEPEQQTRYHLIDAPLVEVLLPQQSPLDSVMTYPQITARSPKSKLRKGWNQ